MKRVSKEEDLRQNSKLSKLEANVAVLREKIDNIHQSIDELKNEHLTQIRSNTGKIEEHLRLQNGRIGKVEQFQSWVYGGLAVIGIFSLAGLITFIRLVIDIAKGTV